MTSIMIAAGVLVGAWFVARYRGRGRPCPVLVAALWDNRIVDKLSGVATLLDRAGVSRGMRVLDAGCGPGRLTIPIARRVGSDGEVLALDVQDGMLERVRRRASREGLANVTTLCAEARRNTLYHRDDHRPRLSVEAAPA
jgi:2-polyprenyl-3-methyl-5-hydroxy-6-metoxy-1,4-benzoquinol methylase